MLRTNVVQMEGSALNSEKFPMNTSSTPQDRVLYQCGVSSGSPLSDVGLSVLPAAEWQAMSSCGTWAFPRPTAQQVCPWSALPF